MVTVHTGGKPPRSCQGESKTGPRASRARTAEGEAVEPVEAVEKLGGNKWKQMETNGNKWKQMETRISKHIQTTNGKIAELSNSAYFTLHNA